MRRLMASTWLWVSLALGGAAQAVAAPSVELVWSATTGTGSIGGSVIDAVAGDLLTLDAVVHGDAAGVLAVGFDLVYDSDVTFGLSAAECPSPPNPTPGLCDGGPGVLLSSIVFPPVAISNVGSGSSMSGFDASTSTPSFASAITVGRAVFRVEPAVGLFSIAIGYPPGGGVIDGNAVLWFPQASASIDAIPEPGTASLLLLGIAVLARRRRLGPARRPEARRAPVAAATRSDPAPRR